MARAPWTGDGGKKPEGVGPINLALAECARQGDTADVGRKRPLRCRGLASDKSCAKISPLPWAMVLRVEAWKQILQETAATTRWRLGLQEGAVETEGSGRLQREGLEGAHVDAGEHGPSRGREGTSAARGRLSCAQTLVAAPASWSAGGDGLALE